MTQQAIVKKILPDGRAVVEVTRQSACGHNCVNCGSLCGSGKTVSSLADNPVGAKAGDTVTLETPSKTIISAALLVYALPLALLIAGYIVAASLGAKEGAALLCGFGAFAVGLAAVVLVNRFGRRNADVEVKITGIV